MFAIPFLLLLPAGQAGAGSLMDYVAGAGDGRYEAECQKKETAHARAVKLVRYVPAHLRVFFWNARPDLQMKTVDEETLVAALKKEGIPRLIVKARGGLGKTRLADSLDAQICGHVPVFRLDVDNDIIPALNGGRLPKDLFEGLIERALGANGKDRGVLEKGLKQGPWVLLVDALDEVAASQRPAVVEAIENLRKRYPGRGSVVIFSRPPVFSDHYGLQGLEAVFAIDPLDCAAARRRVDTFLKNGATVDGFWRFAKVNGLDHQTQPMGRCVYRHLSTYRDIQVVLALAANAAFQPFPKEFDANRASVYRKYVKQVMGHSKQGGGTVLDDMAILEGMMDAVEPSKGIRVLWFTSALCEKVAGGQGRKGAKAVCRGLLGSQLFERHAQREQWRFKNQSITDFLLADWAERWMTSQKGEPDCSALFKLSSLVASGEVAGFLVGLARGSRCVVDIVEQLCEKGIGWHDAATLVDQGLSRHVDRKALVVPAERGCTRTVIDAVKGMGSSQ